MSLSLALSDSLALSPCLSLSPNLFGCISHSIFPSILLNLLSNRSFYHPLSCSTSFSLSLSLSFSFSVSLSVIYIILYFPFIRLSLPFIALFVLLSISIYLYLSCSLSFSRPISLSLCVSFSLCLSGAGTCGCTTYGALREEALDSDSLPQRIQQNRRTSVRTQAKTAIAYTGQNRSKSQIICGDRQSNNNYIFSLSTSSNAFNSTDGIQ